MEVNEGEAARPKLLGVHAAARYYGVSIKTFRDRFMPHVPAVYVSPPGATRQRRLFSVEALDEALRKLQRSAA